MTKINAFFAGTLLTTTLLTACGSFDNYSAHHGPYDRNKLCESLNRQLKYYDDPNYYRAHPISQSKLESLYDEFKANGCDK